MNQKQFHLIRLVKKIGLFAEFELEEVGKLFRICTFQTFEGGQEIYKVGTQSQEMMILLSGGLTVLNDLGEILALIPPGSPVGEMGVFTGEPRSATIVASTASTGIVISRGDMQRLMNTNPEMHLKVLKTLVPVICQRLVAANKLNNQHLETIMKMQDQLLRATGKTSRDLEEARVG
ncbi:MAG: cyclic nucleotide-binding domain-containing protein [Gemmatimonadetes bacterium]|jgi:CRP-like cAMP-binding protein|nr:cyclic nucleotide-binding domain-containing protein [Gemmatimonadota bacterium]